MVDQRLLDYIKKVEAKGVSDSEIKRKLLNIGWKDVDINEAFSSLNKNVTSAVSTTTTTDKISKIESYIKKYQDQGYSKDQIVTALTKSRVSKEEIETAYKRLKAKGEMKKDIDKKWLIIGGVTLLLLLLLGSMFLLWPEDTGCSDYDDDGYLGGSLCGADDWDCDDNDPTINPASSEICDDDKDNDCDGRVDEGCVISYDECDRDSDCKTGETCEYGSCVPVVVAVGDEGDPCEKDLDCAAGLTCTLGICSQYPSGTEGTGIYEGLLENECNDGDDNDNDGFVDYTGGCDIDGDTLVDDHNMTSTECLAINGTYYEADAGCTSEEDNDEKATCQDGKDNDQDGLIDYTGGCDNDNDGDLDLQCFCDMDSDGLIDYPNESISIEECLAMNYTMDDYDCKEANHLCNRTGMVFYSPDTDCEDENSDGEISPEDYVYACEDGSDNDGDGYTDYPDDTGCSSSTDDDESDGECEDGLDNDNDGLTDTDDDDCIDTNDDDEGTNECADGADNDGDGMIDVLDPDCSDKEGKSEGDYVEPVELPDLVLRNTAIAQFDAEDITWSLTITNNDSVDVEDYFVVTVTYTYLGEETSCGKIINGLDAGGLIVVDCMVDIEDMISKLGNIVLTGNCDQVMPVDLIIKVDSNEAIEESDEINNKKENHMELGYTMYNYLTGVSCPTVTVPDENEELETIKMIRQCNDGFDNDGDGLIDEEDWGCLYGLYGDYNGEDNSEFDLCHDGIDNDNDGEKDLGASDGNNYYLGDSVCELYDDVLNGGLIKVGAYWLKGSYPNDYMIIDWTGVVSEDLTPEEITAMEIPDRYIEDNLALPGLDMPIYSGVENVPDMTKPQPFAIIKDAGDLANQFILGAKPVDEDIKTAGVAVGIAIPDYDNRINFFDGAKEIFIDKKIVASNLRNDNYDTTTWQGIIDLNKDLNRPNVNKDLSGQNLIGANLQNIWIDGVNFNNADMRDVNLNGAIISNSDFSDANLINAKLGSSSIIGSNFNRADMSNIQLNDARIESSTMNHAILENANLDRIKITSTSLDNSNIANADMSDAVITKSSLINTNLQGTIANRLFMDNIDVTGADLGIRSTSVTIQNTDLDTATTLIDRNIVTDIDTSYVQLRTI